MSLGKRMHTLKRKIELLEACEADRKTELRNLEFQMGRKRRKEVENWLRNVHTKKDEFQRTEQEVQGNAFLSRIHLGIGNQIEKISREVEELIEQSKFPEGLTLDGDEPKELLTMKLVGRKAEESMKKLWVCIMDDRVFSLGIYGMGGVGKTTLAMHIHNQLLKNPGTYNHVYWVTVSQQFSIYKLQGDIAKVVGITNLLVEENDERKRAAMLFRALANRKRAVLILDDMWEHFTLEKVGIPIGPDECKLILTTRSLSVCLRMGCQRKIKVEPLSEDEAWDLFMEKLKPYDEISPDVEVAARHIAGECGGLPLGIITMARSMRGVDDIREWSTVLKELRESKAGRTDMDEEVFSILRISYGRLKNLIMQQCFLYCALYPEDHVIRREEIIRHFIAEGLIKNGKDSRKAKFDKGHNILNELENVSLLENPTTNRDKLWVKMHDLVRDMALWISGENSGTDGAAGPRFMVKAGLGLREIPEEQEWTEDLERVSLMRNSITEIKEGRSPRCPRLLTLMLGENRGLKKIPDSFFAQMRALKVLDLSCNVYMEKLPNSISDLENLTALLLEGCRRLKHVPSLAKLQPLKELDLGGTAIEKAPEGMGKLVNLRRLSMAVDNENVVVEGETLHQMRHLEEFFGRFYDSSCFTGFPEEMDVYYIEVGCVNSGNWRRPPPFRIRIFSKEVKLDGCSVNMSGDGAEVLVHSILPNVECLTLSKWSNLCALWSSVCELCPPLLRVAGSIALRHGTFSSLKELYIIDCPTIKNLFPHWLVQQYLYSPLTVRVRGCRQLEEIIAGDEGGGGTSTIPTLHTLFLQDLPELKSICRRAMSCHFLEVVRCPKLKRLPHLPCIKNLQLYSLVNLSVLYGEEKGGEVDGFTTTHVYFSALKVLRIENCLQMKNLFSAGLVHHLQNLEDLVIGHSILMEEIIVEAQDDDRGTTAQTADSSSTSNNIHNDSKTISLQKLKTLELMHLPELQIIYGGKMICDSLQIVKIMQCPKLKMLPLHLPLQLDGQPSPPSTLKEISVGEKEWWESLEWDHPNAKTVLQPFLAIVTC
ncbi:putative disease resistance protein At4g10780 isoform X2 [Malania oleifera]|nr:putative disease resistance protein At4g10780 isoform X2 [Malania oleifera]XP_057948683.1 putative disease resistance protein At4g10780 isoform X2 [Malania oleifera]